MTILPLTLCTAVLRTNEAQREGIGSVARFLGVDPECLIGGLNLVEAARVLGISPSTLRQRALSGQIGHQRDGRRWIFSWRDIADYIKRREHPAVPGTVGSLEQNTATSLSRSTIDERVLAEAKDLGLV